jgi:hypothetical protein
VEGDWDQEPAAEPPRPPGLIWPLLCRHRGTTEGSAVCVFTMKDVQKVFDGLYKKVNRETQQWYTETHPAPTPRPGAVSMGSLRPGSHATLGQGCPASDTPLETRHTKPRPACPAELDVM